MPIRDIYLRNVSITAQQGMMWMDAENIHCENVEIINSHGPVLNLFHARDSVIDHLAWPASVEAVIEAQGDSNSGIVIKNTHLKAAVKDFVLTNGATTNAFRVE
jgi:hypothetical protein